MAEVLGSIGRHLKVGAPNGVHMDPESKLIFSPAHFTWMDTNHPAASPRQGYPLEIQALWLRALQLLARIDPPDGDGDGPLWADLHQQVQRTIVERFFLPELGYFSDCLHASPGMPASQAIADDALRPNQLLAITLQAVSAPQPCRAAVQACAELLVPGALRSLADRPVQLPLPVIRDGKTLNDPLHPYQGQYLGDEDTQRKPAYHNGTAWTWLLPQFCEAWATVYGPSAVAAARAWMSSSAGMLSGGCIGHLPEICDGNYPHTARGCDAQAWGAGEWVRVWTLLERRNTASA
jgi:starch synthase (maltosyl-transferring)